MNSIRKKALETINQQLISLAAELEGLMGEEEYERDNPSEDLPESQQYDQCNEACDLLEDAIVSLEDAIDCINNVID